MCYCAVRNQLFSGKNLLPRLAKNVRELVVKEAVVGEVFLTFFAGKMESWKRVKKFSVIYSFS